MENGCEVEESHGYPCHGFNEALPKGKASGTLRVLSFAIEFEIAGHRHQLPFEGLELSVGGAGDRLVFLRHPRLPEWRIYTADRQLLKDNLLREHAGVAVHINRARKTRALNGSVFACVILVIIAIPILLFSQLGNLTAMAVEQVPPEWEQKLGKSVHAQYVLSADAMDQERTQKLLAPLVQPLMEAMPSNPYPFHFSIVNNAQLNAFALPGGYVTIHSGLILAAESAEELLGVVAHEMIHVTQKHGIRNIVSSAGTYMIIGAVLGDVSGILGMVAGAAPLLLNQGYSRDFEREADSQGVALLLAANIDPKGLRLFFEKLIEQEDKQLAQIENAKAREVVKDSLSFLSSHPATEERIARLKKMDAKKEHAFITLHTEFAALQTAVKEFVADNNDEEAANEK